MTILVNRIFPRPTGIIARGNLCPMLGCDMRSAYCTASPSGCATASDEFRCDSSTGSHDWAKVSRTRCCAAWNSSQIRANSCIGCPLQVISLRFSAIPVRLVKPLVRWLWADGLLLGFFLARFDMAGYQICRYPGLFGRTVDARASGKQQEADHRRD
jgi:hypothetical protein